MKIYTKTGDQGKTSLIGGKRVPKHHPRIEAYGTVDELMAFVALLKDQEGMEEHSAPLTKVLDRLMCCASIIAADCDDCKVKIPEISSEDVEVLEQAIDALGANLAPLTSFILPGGHPSVSLCHVARTICRRAERLANRLNQEEGSLEQPTVYLNRLSDYLFVLSRYIAKSRGIEQIPWQPNV